MRRRSARSDDLPAEDAALPADDAGFHAPPRVEPERPSKTRLKQQAHDLQALGQQLATMPESRLAALAMPEALREAIAELRRTRSHEGRRRQLQYVGKQMRAADVEPLREAVAAFQLGGALNALALHEAERWRAELIADDEALTRWAQQHPDSDLQRLRSLVRAARKDASAAPEQRSGRGFRELFQFIRPLLETGGDAVAADGADPADD